VLCCVAVIVNDNNDNHDNIHLDNLRVRYGSPLIAMNLMRSTHACVNNEDIISALYHDVIASYNDNNNNDTNDNRQVTFINYDIVHHRYVSCCSFLPSESKIHTDIIDLYNSDEGHNITEDINTIASSAVRSTGLFSMTPRAAFKYTRSIHTIPYYLRVANPNVCCSHCIDGAIDKMV
jgi:hypothetical protein